MKDIKGCIETEKAKYPVVFNLNVMQELQEEFGSIQEWGDRVDGANGDPNIKALKYGMMLMINEAIDIENEENGTNRPFVTEKQVGRIITEVGIGKASEVLKGTTQKSVDSGEQPKNM